MLGTLGEVLAAIPDALGLGIAAMGFEAAAFERVWSSPEARDLALVAVYFAGVSQAGGHAVVLFLNRVRPARFALSMALMGAIYLASALLTALAAVLVADLAFGRHLPFVPTIAIIALAHAPRLLGFLTLAPFLGEQLDRLLDVWVMTLVIYGLHHGAGLPIQGAALLALLEWGSVRVLTLVFGQPLTVLVNAMKRAAAGGPLTLDPKNLVETLKDEARRASRSREGGER